MTKDLVKVDHQLAEISERQAALAQLNQDAESAATPEDAHTTMVKGRTITHLLSQIKAPLEDSRLAGKASVVAARRLGQLLAELGTERKHLGYRQGWAKSERGTVISELGVDVHMAQNFLRLGRVPDPEFQRYIQRTDIIPSLNGALVSCQVIGMNYSDRTYPGTWRDIRRKKLGVKTPVNASLDEGYSLIVKALGHLSAGSVVGGNRRRKADIRDAIDHLYAAEDILKKHRGGYTS